MHSIVDACLQAIFDKVPGLITQRFKYSHVDPTIQSRDLKPALNALVDAGLLYPVYYTSGSGLPFNATMNDRKFKLLFVDVGLVNFSSGLDASLLLDKNIFLLNRGALAEQFVGQELIAYSENYIKSEIYYWEREKKGSMAEVDYLTHVHQFIYPIEVKAGKTGTLRSL